ncbi:DUF1707 and DUF4190 domain-containing protein [Kitasatospora sp. NPDC048540]|uniref:DUF1707 and DUF4190 domain-containing protein n=1 Tax=Kitasatospora sp. NPDC048540 TaxID=3155634 RepID=UPI0033C7D4E8
MTGQPWGQQQPAQPQVYGQFGPPVEPAPYRPSGPGPAGYPPGRPVAAHPPVYQPASPADLQAAMRASHADRERTVDVLKAAYAEGRLSAEEYSQRFDAVHQAQTYGQLSRLVADLPAGPMPVPYAAAPVVQVVPQTFLPPPVFPVQRRTNRLAVASLALGLFCLVSMGSTAVPAVITGHLAKNQLRDSGEEGSGMAGAGLVIGWACIAGWVFLLLALVSAGG